MKLNLTELRRRLNKKCEYIPKRVTLQLLNIVESAKREFLEITGGDGTFRTDLAYNEWMKRITANRAKLSTLLKDVEIDE